jgi:hypothetical protein
MGMVSGVTETEWCGLGHWIYGTARVGGRGGREADESIG